MISTAQSSTDTTEELYGSKNLRWYQIAARNAVAEHLNSNVSRILIKLPTGAGKTLTVAASLSYPPIREALGVKSDRPLRVLFAAHKLRLLTQAEKTFVAGSNVEIITQSIFSNIPDHVLDKGWDVTILDECHHESCMSFQLQLEHIGDKPLLGLTATDDRADGCLIKFERIVNPISREQAVEEGWLAETELNSFVDTPTKDKTDILRDVISNYGHEMGQTMIFVRTKKEAANVNDVLLESGYRSIVLLSQTEQELNNILDQFSAGEIQFIVNCNRIGEGVDCVGVTDVVLGRQFGSYPQLNQVIGRAARPDSECRVWELINPLSGRNLDTTVVVGTPRRHRLIAKARGEWKEREFDYSSNASGARAIETGLRPSWSTQ